MIKKLVFLSLSLAVGALCVSLIVPSTIKLEPKAKHVILIGADGLGSYAFEKGKFPNIREMMKKGSYSLKARAVLPSSSAVNWMSMLTGSPPEMHGFTTWGSETPEIPSRVLNENGIYPSIFNVIREQKPMTKTAAFYTWGGIEHLIDNAVIDRISNPETDASTFNKAFEYIRTEKPLFTFIHVDEPDHTGHAIGHDTPEYYAAAEGIDSLLGEFIQKLDEENILDDCIILFTADHGGKGKGHGGKTLVEMEIPWIIYGKNVKAKGEIEDAIITYDTGATLAYALGLKAPDYWRGKAMEKLFK